MRERQSELSGACRPLGDLLGGLCASAPIRRRLATAFHVVVCQRCRESVLTVGLVLDLVRRDGSRDHELTSASVRAQRRARFLARLNRQERELLRAPAHQWRWSPVVLASVVVVCSLFLSGHHVAELRAEEILQRAERVEANAPSALVRKVRMQLTPASPVASRDGATRSWIRHWDRRTALRGVSSLQAVLPNQWAQVLLGTPFEDVASPSATAFASFRQAPGVALEPVRLRPTGLLLRARSQAGPIGIVELLLLRDTFEVRRLTIVLRGLGRLDLEEMDRWMPSVATTFETANRERASESFDALERAELDLRFTLAAMRLAPVAPLRLTREGHVVRLDGQVSSPRVRRQLLEAGARAPVVVALRVAPSSRVLGTPGPWIGEWLRKGFQTPMEGVKFLAEVELRVAAVRQGVRALDELAHRYPEGLSGTVENRDRVDALGNEIGQALARDLVRLRKPLTALVGSRPGLSPVTPPTDWRLLAARSEEPFRVLENALRELHSLDATDEEAIEQRVGAVQAAFAALWEAPMLRPPHDGRSRRQIGGARVP